MSKADDHERYRQLFNAAYRSYQYRTKHGFCVSTKWVQEQGQAECNNLDWIERQGLADEYTAKHSAKIAELVIRKAQRDA